MNDFSTLVELSNMMMIVLARLLYFQPPSPDPLQKVQEHVLIAIQT